MRETIKNEALPMILIGSKLIGREVGASAKTVKRWFHSGRFPALFKSAAGPNSPIKCRRIDLDLLCGTKVEVRMERVGAPESGEVAA